MRTIIRTLATLTLAACTPYEPDFTAAPYLCGDSQPRCPTGFTCVADDDGLEICVDGEVPPSRPVHCADDTQYEPNDTLATATAAPGGRTFAMSELSICPAAERDTFAFELADGESVELVVTVASDAGLLEGAILNAGGVPVARAVPRDESVTSFGAAAAGLSAGPYYVQIFSTGEHKGSYELAVTISGP